MTSWIGPAAAKLNLTLEVLGKRDDGFHDLASVAVSLDLADEVRLTKSSDGRFVSYRDDRGRRFSIETEDDIILRAWNALDAHCSLPTGAVVEVVKRIPLTAGLGGGSTDAASFLRLARHAWGLNLSDDELCRIGADVGSDVPACIVGGTVLMSGRGERVDPMLLPNAALSGWSVLLHRPEIPVPAAKTATMYRSLRSTDFRDGSATNAMAAMMVGGARPTQDGCVNSFDQPAREVMVGIAAALRRMGAAIARSAVELEAEPVVPMLAGAGPTLFAVLPRQVAERAADQLSGISGFTYVANPIKRTDATEIRTL